MSRLRNSSQSALFMSDSPEKRRADALALLQSIFSEVADAPIDCTLVDSSDPAYSGTKPTSWDELTAEGLVMKLNEPIHSDSRWMG